MGLLVSALFIYSSAKKESYLSSDYENHQHAISQISTYLNGVVEDLDYISSSFDAVNNFSSSEIEKRLFDFAQSHLNLYQLRFLDVEDSIPARWVKALILTLMLF